MEKSEIQALIRAAFAAQKFAYVPYSRFHVGAALRAKDGRVFGGCNIENAGYTPTNCAERTALFKAVSEGVREFDAIAIVGSKVGETNTLVTGPCGVCRQALYEFGGPALTVIMAKSEEDYIVTTLGELLLISLIGIVVAAIFIALLLPVDFKYGVQKGRLVLFGVAAFIGGGGVLLSGKEDMLDGFFSRFSGTVGGLFFGALTLLLLLISFTISSRIMEKKEF